MVVVVNEAWEIKAEVSFSEYNHKTKKQVQVERQVTSAHKTLIMRQIDSTDCGTFLSERVGDIELIGYFSLVQEEENDDDE
jgi:ABC-type xylose transport system substrate-binding protein